MENSSSSPQLKVVLVTGAAKRMGSAIARYLSERGFQLAIHYNGSEAEARETAAACNNAPIFKANLESVQEIRSLFDEVHSHFGRIDGLVNNAARFTEIDPLKVTEEDWDFIHNVNLKATFFCCQQGALKMQEHGGRIVNISSLGGIRPWARHSHYCASKAGVIMLTKALAKAFAPKITVNSVAPGVFPFGNKTERVERLVCATPAGRAGQGEDIASAVHYFLTGSDFITGQIMAVDGGLSLR